MEKEVLVQVPLSGFNESGDVSNEGVSGEGRLTPETPIADSTNIFARSSVRSPKSGELVVISVGFMTDAYDLFVINLVLFAMSLEYHESAFDASFVATSILVGTIFGQIIFGSLGDHIGRRKTFLYSGGLIMIGAVFSSLVWPVGDNVSIYILLGIARAVLGLGIGGEYPLSATMAAERQSRRLSHEQRVASVFSMQGIGNLLSPLVFLFTLSVSDNLTFVWRFCLGFGAIPCLLTYYFRFQLSESEHFHSAKLLKADFSWKKLFQEHWKDVIGTSLTWFIFDISFYGNGLFSSTVLEMVGLTGGKDAHSKCHEIGIALLFIAGLSLPGYFVSLALIKRMGCRKLQLLGFFGISVVFLIMGTLYSKIVKEKAVFIFLYGLTFFFSNFGPNVTTFVVPTQNFPPESRCKGHGFAAACGKAGAIIGTAFFKPYLEHVGITYTFISCSVLSAIGLAVTYLLVFPLDEGGRNLQARSKSESVIPDSSQRLGPDGSSSTSSTSSPPSLSLQEIPSSDVKQPLPENADARLVFDDADGSMIELKHLNS